MRKIEGSGTILIPSRVFLRSLVFLQCQSAEEVISTSSPLKKKG